MHYHCHFGCIKAVFVPQSLDVPLDILSQLLPIHWEYFSIWNIWTEYLTLIFFTSGLLTFCVCGLYACSVCAPNLPENKKVLKRHNDRSIALANAFEKQALHGRGNFIQEKAWVHVLCRLSHSHSTFHSAFHIPLFIGIWVLCLRKLHARTRYVTVRMREVWVAQII